MRTIHRNIVAGLVVSKDSKFLFGMKNPKSGGVYIDCWHTPGGGVEEGETHRQALKREIAEEVGVNISDGEVALLEDQGMGESQKTLKESGEIVLCKMKFYVYQIDIHKNAADIRVTPGDDIERCAWVRLDELHNFRLAPPSVELFSRLGWL